MNEIEPITEKPGTDVLAGAWSVDRHLSPLALFDPNRSAICAQYQLALVDDSSNEARAHVAAARRHLQAAVNAPGLNSGSTSHPAEFLRAVCRSLDTITRGWD
ncbi:hypothetical protein OG819_22305 [Streptomyces sp. NBC_01549]|uniref:hypothetical protein n=1 Tax=Streptomyces sp. NBC_01549 TaxID=2975874 RepID=UPI0022549BC8|nr:hypothetical protein [Streptomyces sp. NBC_01549]MCX4592364.1 hypothetical protein [Streptomyces sp. NBC_01549]